MYLCLAFSHIMSVRFICVVLCCNSFSSYCLYYSVCCIIFYYIKKQYIYSSYYWSSFFSTFLAIMNSAIIKFLIHAFWCSYMCVSVDRSRSEITGRKIYISLINNSNQSSQMLVRLNCHQSYRGVPVGPHLCQNLPF